MRCLGTPEQHCCWVDGNECQFLQKDPMACQLRSELGSWDAVYQDPRYQDHVQPMFDRIAPGKGCGDWPIGTCATCGITNE